MTHFRSLTLDKPTIMGYSTLKSIGELLPGRTNIILSRKEGQYIPGASVCNDLDSAFYVRHIFNPKICVIEGEQVYREAIKRATRLEMTEIDGKYEGDTYFSEYRDTGIWERTATDSRKGFAFVTYRRRGI